MTVVVLVVAIGVFKKRLQLPFSSIIMANTFIAARRYKVKERNRACSANVRGCVLRNF